MNENEKPARHIPTWTYKLGNSPTDKRMCVLTCYRDEKIYSVQMVPRLFGAPDKLLADYLERGIDIVDAR